MDPMEHRAAEHLRVLVQLITPIVLLVAGALLELCCVPRKH